MQTTHQIFFSNAASMREIPDATIDLTVTSPPYPMIEMWDTQMAGLNPEISEALKRSKGERAFELMHLELDKVWTELFRVTKNGGIVCINVGDATRTIGGNFRLYSNHSRVINSCLRIGFSNLPNILWRKQTNAPNKFMGSGMLPPGAYATLEHEHILIFRKGGKRIFSSPEEKQNRNESAFFWEERNLWFSDVWELKGTRQRLSGESRNRSAAYPFELAYRLVNMFSVKSDSVLDPFAGTGTTMQACMTAARNSIGYEIDESLAGAIFAPVNMENLQMLNKPVDERLEQHRQFVEKRMTDKGVDSCKHFNKHHQFPVVTRQETAMMMPKVTGISQITGNSLTVQHEDTVQQESAGLARQTELSG